jgi:hypothetical protein
MAIKAAATWKILCDQGKTFERTIVYKSGGVPFDNTAFEARMMVKRNYGSTAVISLDSALGTMTLGGANGEISWSVSAIVMEDLIGDYVFDVELYDPNDLTLVIGIVRGTIKVRAEVTV